MGEAIVGWFFMDIAYFVVNFYLLCMKRFVAVVDFSLMFARSVFENCWVFFLRML